MGRRPNVSGVTRGRQPARRGPTLSTAAGASCCAGSFLYRPTTPITRYRLYQIVTIINRAIGDRRFKEGPRPAAVLDAFVDEVHRSISPPDLDRTLRRFLEVAVGAFRATGGEIRIDSGGASSHTLQIGEQTGGAGLWASTSSGALRVDILLHDGDQSRAAAALKPALGAVLDEAIGFDTAVVAPRPG